MSQISNRTAILPARPQPPLNGNDEPAPLDANGKISWEAFMEWVDEDTRAEWVDGENKHANRLQENSVNGAADVVLEIISPESRTRDTQTKLSEYRIGGIPEYWLIDPIQNIAWFYQLQPNGQYQEMPLDEQGRYYSAQIDGFWVKPEWFWENPMMLVNDALLEIAGQTYANHLINRITQKGLQLPPNA